MKNCCGCINMQRGVVTIGTFGLVCKINERWYINIFPTTISQNLNEFILRSYFFISRQILSDRNALHQFYVKWLTNLFCVLFLDFVGICSGLAVHCIGWTKKNHEAWWNQRSYRKQYVFIYFHRGHRCVFLQANFWLFSHLWSNQCKFHHFDLIWFDSFVISD